MIQSSSTPVAFKSLCKADNATLSALLSMKTILDGTMVASSTQRPVCGCPFVAIEFLSDRCDSNAPRGVNDTTARIHNNQSPLTLWPISSTMPPYNDLFGDQ